MSHKEATIGFQMPRPLNEGDQAIIDAIEHIQPGKKGNIATDYILREPARRAGGTFGEVVVGRALNELGQQEVAFIDVQPRGILAGIDIRESGSRDSGKQQLALPIGSDVNSPEAQAIKIEAAHRITLANTAANQQS